MAWNWPMGWPNWIRSLAYCTAISLAASATPACSLARAAEATPAADRRRPQPILRCRAIARWRSRRSSRASFRVWSNVGRRTTDSVASARTANRLRPRGAGRDQKHVSRVAVGDKAADRIRVQAAGVPVWLGCCGRALLIPVLARVGERYGRDGGSLRDSWQQLLVRPCVPDGEKSGRSEDRGKQRGAEQAAPGFFKHYSELRKVNPEPPNSSGTASPATPS